MFSNLSDWIAIINKQESVKNIVNIAIVGKYTNLHDAYKSVAEALKHGAIFVHTGIKIHYIDSESLTIENIRQLDNFDGILVP